MLEKSQLMRHEATMQLQADDLQAKGYKRFCRVCKKGTYNTTLFSNGDSVCDDCLKDYLQEKSALFAKEYLKENEQDFFDYVLNELEGCVVG